MDTKRVRDETLSSCIYYCSIHCAVAWTIYAVVECWFLSILPWIKTPGDTYKPVYYGFTILLFALYPAFGLIVGGLSGFCIRVVSGRVTFLQNVQSSIIFPVAVISTVLLTFAVTLAIQRDLKLSALVIVLICILLIVGMLLSAGSGIWARRIRFITSTWTCCIMIIGISFILLDLLQLSGSRVLKGVSVSTYIAAVLLISYFVQKKISMHKIDSSVNSIPLKPIKSLVFLTFVVLITLGISLFCKKEPIHVESSAKLLPMNDDHPNVILITLDTVRADHLSLYGYERNTTPNLKKFATEANLYTNAMSSGSMTLTTHASIFTGLYARHHGAHPGGGGLSEKHHVLAEILFEKGYLTIGVPANPVYLKKHYGFSQGFEYYDLRRPIKFYYNTYSYGVRNGFFMILDGILKYQMYYRRAASINKMVFAYLAKIKEESRPFFFFINYMDAHAPYNPPSPFDTFYQGKDETFDSVRQHAIEESVLKRECKLTEEDYNHMVSQYDGEIAYLDFHLEELIIRLKELGLYENSLIIITSDHGEAFGEKDLMGHGVSVYQNQVFIPLIIKYPYVNNGNVINDLVSSVDLMPTILDVLEYDIPENIHGQSLIKLESGKPRIIISESYPEGELIRIDPRFDRIERAIFSGQYKFVSSTAGKRELYNLSVDSNENKNLYKANNSKSVEYESKLDQWLKDVKEGTGNRITLDKETLEALKALGYIQ